MEAPAPILKTGPSHADGLDPERNLLGLLREIRVEVLDLITRVDEITRGGVVTQPEDRASQVKAASTLAAARYDHDMLEINGRMQKINGVLDGSPSLRDCRGDVVRRINNVWEYVVGGWPAKDATVDATASGVATVRPYLSDIVFHIALLTIPEPLNARLDNEHIGETLVFSDEFGDEVPDPSQQQKVLAAMQRESAFIRGVVTPDAGVIYKVPTKGAAHAGNILLLVLVALLPFFLPLINYAFSGFDGVIHKSGRLRDLITSYVLVLLGACGHFSLTIRRTGQGGWSRSWANGSSGSPSNGHRYW